MRFKGWKQIFSFTYLQHVKSKAFIGSTIVVCALILIIAIIISVFAFSGDEITEFFGGSDSGKAPEILYICNETDIPDPDQSSFEGLQCRTLTPNELEQKQQEIKTSDSGEVLLHVFYSSSDDSCVALRLYRPENEEAVGSGKAAELAAQCEALFRKSLLTSIGVAENDVGRAQTGFSSEVLVYGSEVSMIRQMASQAVTILMAAMLFIFIVSYAQIIAQSVAMEKTSRVIELLITLVRPLAIVVGKVLAMLLVVITQLAIMGAVGGAAAGVVILLAVSSGVMGDAAGSVADGVAAAAGEAAQIDMSWQTELREAVPGLFDPMAIITIGIVFLLGFIFYALLAALVGAGISRSEDLANGLQPLMFVAMIGFFLSYMPACFNMGVIEASENVAVQPDILTVISRYLPISSPFALPSAILLGQMSPLETAAAVVILAALVFATVMLVAKVYENIILYSGSPLKIGQIIKMAKTNQRKT